MGLLLSHPLAAFCLAWIRPIGAVPSQKRASRETFAWTMAGEVNMARVEKITKTNLDPLAGTRSPIRNGLYQFAIARMLAYPKMQQSGAAVTPCSFPSGQG